MSNRRDKVIALTAALMVVLLAGSVVFAVLSAERNGRQALEELQLAQLDQLARLLDSSLAPALISPSGLTNPIDGKPWNLVPSDPHDRAGLAALQARLPPDTRTGYVLLDKNHVVVNGSLLDDPTIVGRTIDRPGLAHVFEAKSALLPVTAHSLTTPLPTFAIGRPLTAVAGGPVTGVLLQESDVAADSAFNKIMAGFRRARTDDYSFLDSQGIVIASTNSATVGQRADATLLDPQLGFHHHGGVVTATASIPSAGWRAAYRQTTAEFDGNLTAPLRSALLLLIAIALAGAGLTSFTLLSRLRAARREQERLATINEAREEFISIVSHELRTPATGQLGFLQTLLDHWDGLGDAARRRTVAQAYTNARRLHALTRDVLDTASIEAGELPYAFAVIDLAAAVREAVDSVPANAYSVAVAGPATGLFVRADSERVRQVLSNLLDNAIKNSPSGGSIDVSVTATADGEAVVSVADHGPGIANGDLERAFDKFVRGRHTTTKGTGLGLFISRKVIEAHGGRIWISSGIRAGATVAFALPLVGADHLNRLPQPTAP